MRKTFANFAVKHIHYIKWGIAVLKNNNLQSIESQLNKVNNLRFWFYAIWFVLTFVQATFTELIDDEAYYWVYANNLDWGHFHQPPMVALLIKIGYWLIPTGLGVRLLFIFLHLGTIWLIEQLTYPKNTPLFIALVTSVGLLHIGGFWAVPDICFVFFAALFLYLTKQYLKKDSLKTALLIGTTIACMLYSKYHSVVVIFFAIVANWQLFKRWTFYVAGFTGLILFLPHLYWEFQNDFVTVTFHWSERNKIKWHIGLTLTYIASIFVILGPLISPILLKQSAIFKSKTDTQLQFNKTLKTVAFGLLGFFFVMSLRGPVEANWVIATLIPLIVLTHQALYENEIAKKWLFRLLPFSLLIAIVVRSVIIFDIIPNEKPFFMKFRDFHGVENWVQPLAKAIEEAGDYPPIFAGSYQVPSKYSFYTQKFSTGLAASTGPRTQFDLYHWEQEFIGDTVLYFSKYPLVPCTDSVETNLGRFYYRQVNNFICYATVKLETEMTSFTFPPDTLVSIPIRFNIPENVSFDGDRNSKLSCQIFENSKFISHQSDDITIMKIDKLKPYHFQFKTPKKKGDYKINISIESPNIFTVHNTPRLKMKIE
ncbi:MAG: ArnT family glycosyltransferase [Saprospiraceae bacterium]